MENMMASTAFGTNQTADGETHAHGDFGNQFPSNNSKAYGEKNGAIIPKSLFGNVIQRRTQNNNKRKKRKK
jgi:hypothetical protein